MRGSGEERIHREIERVARESYGRLVAYLSAHTRDVAAAEDALGGALLGARGVWPHDALPKNPEAWLLTAARHSTIDLIRHQRVVSESEPTLLLLKDSSTEVNVSTRFPDERLKHHIARASGSLGRLARGLPADRAVQVVELARQLRRRALA